MPTLDQFLGAAEARQAIIDGFSAEVSEEMPKIVARLMELVDEYLQGGADALSMGELSSVAAFQDLLDLVDSAGLGDVADSAIEKLRALSVQAETTLRLSGLTTGQLTFDAAALEQLITYKVESVIRTIAEPIAREVQDAWVSSTFTGKPIREAMAEVGAMLADKTPSQAETLVGTTFNAIDRSVTAGTVDASDDDIVYLYVGPSPEDGDKITRKTCKHAVNKVWTREQIARLENGQIPDVFLHGGGWNCRHSWQPMSRQVAAEMGLDFATEADISAFNQAAA